MLVDKDKCTGCGACVNACEKEAIKMIENQEGFLEPFINKEKCNNCKKCDTSCPLLNNNIVNECNVFINMSSKYDEQIGSASGGAFWLFAKKIIEKNGYVAGAVWDDDWGVKHVVSDNIDMVQNMRGSKYVQSDTRYVFKECKNLLEAGNKVLFSGCPCQVAGLKAYLKKEYDSLFTIDVICHGVPSPKLWKQHIEDLNISKIEDISFRKKDVIGWEYGITISTSKGINKIENDSYLYAFLNDMIHRTACYNCKFRNNYFSDITIGDAWHLVGANVIPKEKKRGFSVCIPHNEKGKKLLLEILPECEYYGTSNFDNVVCSNSSIVDNSKKLSLQKKLYFNYTNNTKPRFDVFLLAIWSNNYGNALNNFALYKMIEQLGYSVMILSQGSGAGIPKLIYHSSGKHFTEFADNNFNLSSFYYTEIDNLNDVSDCFVVGSDQIWNYNVILRDENNMKFYMLDFTDDDKKKISYSTSFGATESLPYDELTSSVRRCLSRFDRISVREKIGVEYCNKMGIKAEHTLDPVFLLDKKMYDNLVNEVCDEKYIFAYILTPTKYKVDIIDYYSKHFNLPVKIVCDGGERYSDNVFGKYYDDVLLRPKVEKWLGLIRGAEFIITDSFHGTCFSLIFHKRFLSVRNREKDRFDTFKEIPEVKRFVIDEGDDYRIYDDTTSIDYSEADEWINKRKEHSINWLKEALELKR